MNTNRSGSPIVFVTLASITLGLLSACHGRPPPPTTYSLGVAVTGLTGSLVLRDNIGDNPTLSYSVSNPIPPNSPPGPNQDLAVATDGSYSFPQRLVGGTRYRVSVVSHPANQACTVVNGAGAVGSADVTGISVNCVTTEFVTFNAVARLDNTVPGTVAAMIAKVVSTAASAGLGGSLEVPSAPSGGQAIVYAVDINENIVLAATASSPQITLNADSTALALARVLLGAIPAGLKPADVDAAIRATAEFPRLVGVINTALGQGTSPLSAPVVFDLLNNLIAEMPASIFTQLAAAQSPAPATAPAAGKEAPADSIARRLYGWSASNVQALFLAGVEAGNKVKVSNGMSIAWAATSADMYGNPICPQKNLTLTNPCSVILAPAGFVRQGAIPSHELLNQLSAQEVPGNAATFKLLLSQDVDTRKANMIHVVEDGVRFALGMVTAGAARPLPTSCPTDLANILLPADPVNSLASSPSSENFQKYLDTIGVNSEVSYLLNGKLTACFGGTYPSAANVPEFVRITLIFYRDFGLWVVRNPATVSNVANTGIEAGLTLFYWNGPGTTMVVQDGRVRAESTLKQPR
jgi:hypothetical protein